eukprot:863949-Pleurochrysis_carterae.AAC.1
MGEMTDLVDFSMIGTSLSGTVPDSVPRMDRLCALTRAHRQSMSEPSLTAAALCPFAAHPPHPHPNTLSLAQNTQGHARSRTQACGSRTRTHSARA